MLTPEQLAEIRERNEEAAGLRYSCNLGPHYWEYRDVRAMFEHIEELTTQFAQEVEENAKMKKEIERLSAQLQVATVDLVLAQKKI